MKLEELSIYQLSMNLAEEIWPIITKWDYFNKDTIGKQLIRSVDSVGANLSEGFGRYHFKENINFCYYSRGSLYETKTWIVKAKNRNLLSEESYLKLVHNIDDLGIKLNNYIKTIGKHRTSIKQK